MTSPDKSELMTELKMYLLPDDYNFVTPCASIFIDFMSYIRSQVFDEQEKNTFRRQVVVTLTRLRNAFPEAPPYILSLTATLICR